MTSLAALVGERDAVTVEEVPAAEWVEKLSHVEPFATHGFPNPQLCKVICATTAAGKVVACWWIMVAWHVEPLWIDPEHRKRPGLIRRLWDKVRSELIEQGAPVAFGIIQDPGVVGMAARLGFDRAPGDLYFLRVEQDKES